MCYHLPLQDNTAVTEIGFLEEGMDKGWHVLRVGVGAWRPGLLAGCRGDACANGMESLGLLCAGRCRCPWRRPAFHRKSPSFAPCRSTSRRTPWRRFR